MYMQYMYTYKSSFSLRQYIKVKLPMYTFLCLLIGGIRKYTITHPKGDGRNPANQLIW